jgi:hypothetical protein
VLVSAGTTPGAHFGLYISNTTHVAVQPSVHIANTSQLPDNTTLLMYVSPGIPYGNFSITTASDRVSLLLCSNATVFMGGAGFWTLAQQNVEEQVLASTGAVVSTRKLFAGPQTGEVQHVLSGVTGQTVIFTKLPVLDSIRTT